MRFEVPGAAAPICRLMYVAYANAALALEGLGKAMLCGSGEVAVEPRSQESQRPQEETDSLMGNGVGNLAIMASRGSRSVTACGVLLAAVCLSSCSTGDSEPPADQQRAAHLDRLRDAYRLGRSAGLKLQDRKIADRTPPADSSWSEEACVARWTQLGEREQTSGDRAGFLAACSSFPQPGLPGYDEAVAEARGTGVTP